MTRYGSGVYSIVNRHHNTPIEYNLDNQRYIIGGDMIITAVVNDILTVNTNLDVYKIANKKDSIIGNVGLYTG